MDKPGHTALGEHSGQFLRLAYFGKHQSSGLFKSHDLVVIDTLLGILGHTQFFMEKRNAVFKIRHNRSCLVYECLRHGNSGEGEL